MDRLGEEQGVLVWTDGLRCGLVERVLGRASRFKALAVGGPQRGAIAALADTLGVKLYDDLRRMLIEHKAQWLLAGTSEDCGPQELKAAAEGGFSILALDPAARLAETNVPGNPSPQIHLAPSIRQCPAWLSAAEPLETVGRPRSLAITSMCPTESGTLLARAYETVEMLVFLMGVPQTISAALTGGTCEPPEEPMGMTGDLTLHARYSGSHAAVIHASDRAAGWTRSTTLLGENGQLTLDDASYTLTDRDGKVIDALEAVGEGPDPAQLIAYQWQRTLSQTDRPRTVDPGEVAACLRAALLSCRTAQLESPDRLLKMKDV